MAIALNDRGYQHARRLIEDGRAVRDGRDDWSEHQPSTRRENEFLAEHGFDEYQKWFLGVDHDEPENSKQRYRFPYGDFEKVHRCAIIAAESRAGQYRHYDIEVAVAHLHGMLDRTG